jgi:hypothetical protein
MITEPGIKINPLGETTYPVTIEMATTAIIVVSGAISTCARPAGDRQARTRRASSKSAAVSR